jgi:hypothetical protein
MKNISHRQEESPIAGTRDFPGASRCLIGVQPQSFGLFDFEFDRVGEGKES